MKAGFNFRNLLPHLLITVIFAVLSVGFMSPILKGKTLNQSDTYQMRAVQSEIRSFEREHPGEYTGWTNSMFGGMPTYLVGGDYSKSVFIGIQPYLYRLFTQQGTFIFLYMIGAYILMLCMGANSISSVLTSVAFGFFSLNILIIEAGHLAKVYALAFVPLVIGGLILAFRKNIWLGAIIFSLGVGLEINANHYQMTYYSLVLILFVGIFEIYNAFKSKTFKNFITASLALLVFGGLAVATNTSRLWTTMNYSKETSRGGSELIDKVTKKPNLGLDKEYAFSWSYGKLESFTFLIPNFSGGASGGKELDMKSETAKALTGLNIDANQALGAMNTYWGDQTFVGGTTYSGAVLIFLFILGLFFRNSKYTFPFFISAIFCLFIAWGGNLYGFNSFLFDNMPMFNKFRALSSILSLFQLCLAVVAGLGVHKILSSEISWGEFKKPLYISLGITAGICLAFYSIPSLVDFQSINDKEFVSGLKTNLGDNQAAADTIYKALLLDRESLLSADALRSLIFILLAAVILWLFSSQKVKNINIIGGALAFLLLVDLWGVNKRYLNSDDFERQVKIDDQYVPTPADTQILQDKSLSYRVIDVTSSPFTNSMTSAFHKSVGGYSAVKLSKFDDLINNQISKNNMAVLNMLNTKYFITNNPQTNQKVSQLNPDALGNAWFVKEIKFVNNANEEMSGLDSLKPLNTVIIDKRYQADLAGFKPSADVSGSIKLTEYLPNKLVYEFDSPKDQMVVFSEVFYKGNEDWISTIDGKVEKHVRANYVLRAMPVKAGKHKIEFKFDPTTVTKGQQIDKFSSIAWVLLCVGAVYLSLRKKDEESGK